MALWYRLLVNSAPGEVRQPAGAEGGELWTCDYCGWRSRAEARGAKAAAGQRRVVQHERRLACREGHKQLMAVSVSSVQKAGKIRRDGIPELEAAIAAGRATIGAAYWLAMNAAPETQRWALG
jgi:hypothetical protein